MSLLCTCSELAVHTQKLSEAETLKQEGNQLYAKGDVEGAVVSSLPLLRMPPLSYMRVHSEQMVLNYHRLCNHLQAKYREALHAAPEAAAKQRAVYFANLAACHLKSKHYEEAVQDSAAALELDQSYVKALMRRSAAYEHLDDLEHALADSQKVVPGMRLHLAHFAGKHTCA